MKKIITVVLLYLSSAVSALACTVCKKNQPALLEGITHGTGPESEWDYLIVMVTVAVVIGTLLLSVRLLVKPNESEQNHIKRSVINPGQYE